jgi:hypothetical protein
VQCTPGVKPPRRECSGCVGSPVQTAWVSWSPGLSGEMVVVVGNPTFECSPQGIGAGPFLQPEALFFEGAHHPLGVCIALGVLVAGKRLLNPQGRACRHERHRGGLTAVVTQQTHPLAPSPVGELAVRRQLRRPATAGRYRARPRSSPRPFSCTNPGPGRWKPRQSPPP